MENDSVLRYGSSLQFPCGLVEDSSITVVGFPNGLNRSFQIELIGSKLKDEIQPPVVLHYEVSLPRDELKEDSVITQNAWTAGSGWGKDEKCPAHRSTSNLEVSEDLDLIDVERLKAPLLPRKTIIMLIGVFSTGNNFEHRMALRRSWMKYEIVRSGQVAVRFFIGLHKNSIVNAELWREAQTYGDIQLMPFVDYYDLITLKTIAICLMGTKILPAKYLMKTDDDAFVRIDEILAGLKGKPPNGLLYGLISFDSEPIKDSNSKWYISDEELPHSLYPPWAHGP